MLEMNRIDRLLEAYRDHLRLPSPAHASGPERTWFVVYRPPDERRLRRQLGSFELATTEAGREWRHCDLTHLFARWIAQEDYRDEYFKDPSTIEASLETDFLEFAADQVRAVAACADAAENAVLALSGTASLFGLAKLAHLIKEVLPSVEGRLAVFFPGTHEDGIYRHLGATDGWNYLAVPIVAKEG